MFPLNQSGTIIGGEVSTLENDTDAKPLESPRIEPMKSLKRKTISALLVLTLLMATLPSKPANAAIMMATAGNDMEGGNNGDYEFFNDISGPVGWVGFGGLLTGFFLPWSSVGKFVTLGGIALLVLDTDGSVPQNQIALGLNQKFPFLDNQESVNALAAKIAFNYELQKDSMGRAMVSVSNEDTAKLISADNLSAAQILEISNFLK